MRDKSQDAIRLNHILTAISDLQSHTVEEWEAKIKADPIVGYALVKLIEIIGEASYKLTKEFKESHPQTEWSTIEGMRHVLVHDYYKIKLPRVLDVMHEDIPKLRSQIESYLSNVSKA